MAAIFGQFPAKFRFSGALPREQPNIYTDHTSWNFYYVDLQKICSCIRQTHSHGLHIYNLIYYLAGFYTCFTNKTRRLLCA